MPIQINNNGEIIELNSHENGKHHLLRSNEVTELISKKPSFIVRWGITLLFAMALVLLVITWFIRYPDIVPARAMLNSINAPKEIITKTPGKLIKLFAKEGQLVRKDELIGFIESTANHTEVIKLSEMLDTISTKIETQRTNEVPDFLARNYNNLGELQAGYQTFSQSLQQFTNYLNNGFYLRKKIMLLKDMNYLQRLHNEQMQQRALIEQDLLLTDTTFQANQRLKDQKVISAFDYRAEKSKLISKQLVLPQINSSIISNENQQHEKQKEIAELENQVQQQKNIFIQSLNTLKSLAEDWKKKYLLTAPIDGKVSFTSFLQENQELKAGQLICYINPENTSYYAEALIPQYNFGKVKTGQEVLLKFPAYPWQEFGSVKGRIEFISTVPSDSGYFAKLSFTNGLITNYKKSIQYRTGLTAEAEIITADLRLAERFINSLRKNTSR